MIDPNDALLGLGGADTACELCYLIEEPPLLAVRRVKDSVSCVRLWVSRSLAVMRDYLYNMGIMVSNIFLSTNLGCNALSTRGSVDILTHSLSIRIMDQPLIVPFRLYAINAYLSPSS